MNIKEHIEAGHYPTDSKGRALVPVGCDQTATICATDAPGGKPILGFIRGDAGHTVAWCAWDEIGNNSPGWPRTCWVDLLPPPPRKVKLAMVARVTNDGLIRIHYCQPDNPDNRAEVSKNVMHYGGQMVLLTGEYEQGWES